ncbi:MAG: hypothetical protein DRO05_01680 [Thermoproteota archaeon]|nr:MAG: hypothetical protein DRO05_01680 [Candidatus Korarchaeota archaeon]
MYVGVIGRSRGHHLVVFRVIEGIVILIEVKAARESSLPQAVPLDWGVILNRGDPLKFGRIRSQSKSSIIMITMSSMISQEAKLALCLLLNWGNRVISALLLEAVGEIRGDPLNSFLNSPS